MPGNQIVKPDYETPLIQSRRASRLSEGVVTEMTNLFSSRNYALYVTDHFSSFSSSSFCVACIKGSVANQCTRSNVNLFPFPEVTKQLRLGNAEFRASDLSILTKFPLFNV